MAEIHDLVPTDASNTGRFPEGQAPSTLNNGARALEGIISRFVRDTDFSSVATLSGSVIQVTVNRTSLTLTGTTSNYVANLMIGFTMGGTALVGSGNLNINGIGAIALRDIHGVTLSGTMILAGDPVLAMKDNTNNYFRMLHPMPASGITLATTSLAGAGFFLDEDNMASDSDTKVASQQSTKAYVDAKTRIRQIVQATKTDTFTTTNTTYTDITGATLTITPSSTSSKILILCFGAWGMSTAGLGAHITLVRDSTEIIRGDAASSRVRATVGGDTSQDGQINQFAITYLDSPATVAATTYKLQVRAGSGGTACIGRAGIDTDNADSSRVPLVIIALEYL